jgi:hypothetical protein
MFKKRSAIVLLVGLNLLLLVLLLIGSYSPAVAYAAGGAGRAGDYICVTAKAAGQSYDVVYVLDRPERKLHAFYPQSVQSRKYVHGAVRDLALDFGR